MKKKKNFFNVLILTVLLSTNVNEVTAQVPNVEEHYVFVGQPSFQFNSGRSGSLSDIDGGSYFSGDWRFYCGSSDYVNNTYERECDDATQTYSSNSYTITPNNNEETQNYYFSVTNK